MDVAINILLQAATIIGNAALGETSKRTIGVAWDAMREAVKRRFGTDHLAPALLDSLRNAAGNQGQMAVIQTQLAPLQLDQYAEVLAAIDSLSTAIKQQNLGGNVVIHGDVKGAVNVYGDQTINFN